jgi:hypothetical protein
MDPLRPTHKSSVVAYLLFAQLALVAILGAAWCVNLYKFAQCDFAPSWKGEIIHAVGLLPPAALVTVWFNDK